MSLGFSHDAGNDADQYSHQYRDAQQTHDDIMLKCRLYGFNYMVDRRNGRPTIHY